MNAGINNTNQMNSISHDCFIFIYLILILFILFIFFYFYIYSFIYIHTIFLFIHLFIYFFAQQTQTIKLFAELLSCFCFGSVQLLFDLAVHTPFVCIGIKAFPL